VAEHARELCAARKRRVCAQRNALHAVERGGERGGRVEVHA
jgi:hypothetical protein